MFSRLAPLSPLEFSRAQTPPGARLAFYFVAWFVTALLFLALNGMAEASNSLKDLSSASLLTNLGLVLLAAYLGCWLLAGLTLALDVLLGTLLGRWRHEPVLFLLFFAFFSVNLLFFKYRFEGVLRPFPLELRATLAPALLLLPVAFYLRYREAVGSSLNFWAEQTRWFLPASAVGMLLSAAFPVWALVTPGASIKVEAEGHPNVILVTFDALSARHTSLYGYERPTTPNLEALAEEGAVFEGMHAFGNNTLYTLPTFLGLPDSSSSDQNLLEALAERGYDDRCFISFKRAGPLQLRGFSEEVVVAAFRDNFVYRTLRRYFRPQDLSWIYFLGSQDPGLYFNPYILYTTDEFHTLWSKEHHPVDLTFEAALNYLEEHPRNTFLWVHQWLPHAPYQPQPPFLGHFGGAPAPFILGRYSPELQPEVDRLRNLYDEYILMGDAHLGRFVEGLRRRGLLDQSLLLVSADHGESFTSGYAGHGYTDRTHEAISNVPLLLRVPGRYQGLRTKTFCGQLDVAPTVLALLGLPVPASMEGEVLLPYLDEPERRSTKPRFTISSYTRRDVPGEVSVYLDDHKLTVEGVSSADPDGGTCRLYNLRTDPDEAHDLAAERPDLVRRLRNRVPEILPLLETSGSGQSDRPSRTPLGPGPD